MVLSGKYKSGEKILHLANERSAVPEIFFNPSDIGIHERGFQKLLSIQFRIYLKKCSHIFLRASF